MNECFFMGNLVKDPELKHIGANSTALVNFTVAVNRVFKRSNGESVKETIYVDCEAWDTGAETIARHFTKGDKIMVHCSYAPNKWKDKETEQNRLTPRFRVTRFYFASNSSRSDADGVETSGGTPSAAGAGSPEGDIPF
jgi:single-strand DNA-binding protein